MTKTTEPINPPGLYEPKPNGYSHVAVAAPGTRLVLVSGHGGENEDGTLSADFQTQVRQAPGNMTIALRAAGAGPQHVARLLALLLDHTEERLHVFDAELDRVWGDASKPACTLIPLPRPALDGMLLEIEATLVVPA
ncbi:MAG: RidA family protein [Methylibium sp.]|uniref:RidA family protein n=1 Tax=Methylibium sp. TaxID=2067992 RepID=UPI00179C9525|nr:RidA family protein [Methylibium sp.]MBA2722923.1 RidA family protein [Methylibium sp.]MBA3590998.1 RidA family protein [Methylibium sp.]MBA3624006.1 RidA family protein [Methylibium sp.]